MKTDYVRQYLKPHSTLLIVGLFVALGAAATSAQMNDVEAIRAGRARAAIDRAPVSSSGPKRVWQMTGPFGGDVFSLAIDPTNSDIVLIGTQDGQIFRSTDGGTTWRRLKPGLSVAGIAVTAILFDRSRPGVIYVAGQQIRDTGNDTVGGGVFVSENNGESWRELEGMRDRSVRGLVQAVKDPAVFAVAARDGIYRTKNRGASWRRITPENEAELRNFHSVAIDPRDVDTIYAGTTHLPWKTTDGGQTWKRAGTRESGMIDDSDIFAIHIDEVDPDVVLMSACSGIYRSTNASKQWAKIQGIPSTSRRTHVIYQHPTRSNVLFAGTTEGLWRSAEGGKPETWGRVTPLRLVINAVAVHPDHPDRILLGTDDYGVLISNDGGESYDPSNAGFISRQIRTVVADRTERGRIYAGVIFDGANGGLFVSEDRGISWQQSMRGMGVRDVYSIYQPATHPETLYAGTNYGVFRSDDHGRNWTQVKKELPEEPKIVQAPVTPVQTTVSNAPRPRRVSGALSVRPIVKKQTKTSLKRTQTKNQARAKKRAPVRPPKPVVALKPPDDGMVNLQSQVFHLVPFVPAKAAETPLLLAATWDGLFVMGDEKKGWKPLKVADSQGTTLTLSHINALATHSQAPGLIWIGTEEGLFVSRDDGESFARIVLEGESQRINAIAFDPRRVETVYVGTGNGFFLSVNGGRSWEQRGGGMPQVISVSGLEVNPLNPDEIYVGDNIYGNFYHSLDSGRTWEPLDISALPSRRLWALAADPFDRNRLYAGSVSGGVYVLSVQTEK